MYSTIEVTAIREGILEIAFNRPEKLNAISTQLETEVSDALTEADNDPLLRAVFIVGRGRCFSAGRDMTELGWLATAEPAEILDRLRAQDRWLGQVWKFRQPVVAVVHGPALGQASELVGRCDLAICSSTATFGWPEVRAGGVPASVWPVVLNNPKRVKEWFMTGRIMTASDAEASGLVNLVTTDAQLSETYNDLATNLAALDPKSLAAVKTLVNEASERNGALQSVEQGHLYNAMSHESDLAVGHWNRVATAGARGAADVLNAAAVPYWATATATATATANGEAPAA